MSKELIEALLEMVFLGVVLGLTILFLRTCDFSGLEKQSQFPHGRVSIVGGEE